MNMPWHHSFDPALLGQALTLDHQTLLARLNQLAQQRGLVTGLGRPLQFVPQSALPAGQPYEQFIAQTGCVPTRNNRHDRYNALLWISAPNTKAALNRAQAEAIAMSKPDKSNKPNKPNNPNNPNNPNATQRGPARDALTLWDENLAVIVLPAPMQAPVLAPVLASGAPTQAELNQRMANHDWQWLFIDQRSQWGQAWQVAVFGHALLEKLDQPFKAITAHSLVIQAQSFQWPAIDQALSLTLQSLQQETEAGAGLGLVSPAIFKHLPVMGIPGWHPENDQPAFYMDTKVFRPAHHLRQAPISGDA
jgi:hypothetical protein